MSAAKQEIDREGVEDHDSNDADYEIILQQHFDSGKAVIYCSSSEVPEIDYFHFVKRT